MSAIEVTLPCDMIQDKFQMTLHGTRCNSFTTSTANSFAFASAGTPEGGPASLRRCGAKFNLSSGPQSSNAAQL